MVINSSKIKSEALLLFCRELINSYKNNNDELFNISKDIIEFIDLQTEQLLKAINVSIQNQDYYIRNKRVSRISIILKTYEQINSDVTKQLQNGRKFKYFRAIIFVSK